MNIDIGKKIYELRKNKNMTQEQLASEMGVSIAAVSKWETGNSIPDLLMLCSLADFFNISTDELLGRIKNKKVIITDDSKFIRETLRQILSENGCEVIAEAADGDELMNILKVKKADLVMLDVKMPRMDGMEALKLIKRDYPDIKVIMCSAVNDKEVMDKVIDLGAFGYVVKPFIPETIIGWIGRVN
jgi:two-component system, chemotaxis family, chemotaxis protein CheY